MKYLLTIALGIILCGSALAQDGVDGETKGKLQDMNRDRLIVELNHNRWLKTPSGMEVKNESRGFNFYLMYDIALGGSNFSFAPGIGLGNRNIYHTGGLTELQDTTYFVPLAVDTNLKKVKLSTSYVDVPVEFRFRTNPDKNNNSFKVALGFKAGYLIASHSKVKLPDAFGDVVKVKKSDIRNLNPFRYGATFRIGYSDFNLVAFYSLSTLFETNKGPEITPISIGISFNGL